MAELVQAVRLFSAEWPAARALWQQTDPRLCAVTPSEPVDRLMEVMPTAFGALVRAILHQQVSIAAGRAICGRLVAACGGAAEPNAVLALSAEALQMAGLSRGKIRYVRALAAAAADGLFVDIDDLPEEEVERRLVALPGIGLWTARMFLLFHLARPDIFSGDDLGLREAVAALDGLDAVPTPAAADARAEAWRPYRSIAAVSLWDFLRRTRLERRAASQRN